VDQVSSMAHFDGLIRDADQREGTRFEGRKESARAAPQRG